MKNVYGRPLTKGVDTGPSCKELGLFNKYNCFTFDLHVCRLILESEGKNMIRPISGLFSPQNKLLFIKVSPRTKRYGLVFDKRVVDPDTFKSYPYGYTGFNDVDMENAETLMEL